MEDRRLLRIGLVVAVALVLFLIWWLWPPTANPDTASVDFRARNAPIDVLANDSDLFHRAFFIKDWSKGANGGTVALAPGGAKLVYTPPHDHSISSDSFTYSIWTRHGFPSTASVTVTITGVQPVNPVGPPPSAQNAAPGCPRDQAQSSDQSTPQPKQYGNCFAIYFSWDNSRILSQHRDATWAMLRAIVGDAAGKTVVVKGYTDTSGVHYDSLSKERACAAVGKLRELGIDPASVHAFADGVSDPAVQTAAGIRERLNRRVEILISAPSSERSENAVTCAR